ncbi:probable amino acid permease 7 [Aristolochia californica]|uniref:probable amino acid permease 7 n=1 Tax=Aristolochia californica TaxID=171875 RepID=UPI0035D5C9FC
MTVHCTAGVAKDSCNSLSVEVGNSSCHGNSAELTSVSGNEDDFLVRTGTVWNCVAHIITAVIGSGVLSLAWSVAQLGWIAGPVSMLSFAIVTYISSLLLSDCYRSPNPVTGRRNRTYMDAVKHFLGEKHRWFCGLLQFVNLYGCGIAYTITTSISMRAIQKSNCFHKEGHQASCSYGDNFYMLLFGAIQIVFSQIPNLHNMVWLSVVASLMSLSYSSIGFGLGFAMVIGNGRIKGSTGGVTKGTAAKKMWSVSQAIGDIAFAYPYSLILLEIQDTLKSPPAENRTMKKASMISIFITTFFYLLCGCFGYAAFGNDTSGNLLTGFGFYEPFWLIDFANVCVIIHLVGGYQVYSQPVFAVIEKWFSEKYPNSGFVNEFYTLKAPLFPAYKVNILRLCFRTVYVVTTTTIAMIFPYFNQVLGVLGAINFWPLTIYFPVEMYFVQREISAWTKKWVVLRTLSVACFLVTVVALVGSIEGLISAKLS